MEKEHHEHEEHKEHKEHKEHEEREEHHQHEEYEERHADREGYGRERDEKIEREEKAMGEIGEGMKMEGLHLKKRDLWLVAGGALGAIAALGLGKLSAKARPAAVGAVREGYAFKEWLAGKAEKAKEDVEDIVAEGVHQYHSNLAATSESVQREKGILEKIEKLVDSKLAKMKSEQGEG